MVGLTQVAEMQDDAADTPSGDLTEVIAKPDGDVLEYVSDSHFS